MICNDRVYFKGQTWDSISDSCKEFIKCLLEKDKMLRVSASEALEHDWIMTKGPETVRDIGSSHIPSSRDFAHLQSARQHASVDEAQQSRASVDQDQESQAFSDQAQEIEGQGEDRADSEILRGTLKPEYVQAVETYRGGDQED